jgi:hypothetical protein
MNHRAGSVGYEDGHFVHYCHCGKWGAFGEGVALNRDQLGKWYCREHWPHPVTPPPVEEPQRPFCVGDRVIRKLQDLKDERGYMIPTGEVVRVEPFGAGQLLWFAESEIAFLGGYFLLETQIG